MSGPRLKRCRGYGDALYTFRGYSAIIPHIQNVYGAEQEEPGCGWSFCFKYQSGVFEYFAFPSKAEADAEHSRLCNAIDEFWRGATHET